MKNTTFSPQIENIYSSLSNEKKAEYIRKENTSKKVQIVMGIILMLLALALLIVGVVLYVQSGDYMLLVVGLFFTIASILIAQWSIRSNLRDLNLSDEVKIKMHIKQLEIQKEIEKTKEEKLLQQNVNYRLAVDKIKNVTIVDTFTEFSDKLHAILNYQEIIQTRIYKFKVDYIDGVSQVITTTEGSEEYSILILHVNNTTKTKTNSEDNNIEKIREYKKLLDEGIITQEEFDKKKQELL